MMKPDIVVMLHVTAPLRIPADIDACIHLLETEAADNVFSVTRSRRNPYYNMVEFSDNSGNVRLIKQGNFPCVQAAPQVFDMNASIYVWRAEVLKKKAGLFLGKTRIYVMPTERSIDIDEPIDFIIAEAILRHRKEKET